MFNKNKKSIRTTETGIAEILANNPHLKINKDIINKSISEPNKKENSQKLLINNDLTLFLCDKKPRATKLSLDNNVDKEILVKSKSKGVKVNDINKLNKAAIVTINYDQNYVGIVFNGARLLSANQIFAILQIRIWQMFNYKETWRQIIKDNIKNINDLPIFDKSVEITLFRQAPRLVDMDSLSVMFKYIIDATKYKYDDKDKKNYGIISEDNPKIVKRIVLQQEKGEYCVGIKIRDISHEKEEKEKFNSQKILDK